MNDFISVILTAAGSGERMGSKDAKQFLKINDRMVIQYTLDVFTSINFINEIILVIRPQDYDKVKDILKEYPQTIKIVNGGKTREESTYHGISNLNKRSNIVICHDACRPFITKDIIQSAYEALNNIAGVITCVPVKDTIKYCNTSGFVEYTPNREKLKIVQTPQVFRRNLLEKAYENVFDEDIHVTDDSSLLELCGESIKIIYGDYMNIKITTPEDLLLGKLILESREENED